ncbi:MAG TPA: hypothetical protein VF950_26835 [Planctomycetota bacterium]
MFSDRFWGLKAALAAAAFAALCRWSDVQVRQADPPVESVPLRSELLRGRVVHVSAKEVTASHPDWVEVLTAAGTIRLIGQTSPAAKPGDILSAVGTVAGPREIRADRLRLHPGYAWKRPLNYAVSFLALALFVAWAAPLFQLRGFVLRSRH